MYPIHLLSKTEWISHLFDGSHLTKALQSCVLVASKVKTDKGGGWAYKWIHFVLRYKNCILRTVFPICFVVDIIPCDDAIPARGTWVTNGEDQLPFEGHLEHPADHLTFLVVWKVCLPCHSTVWLSWHWVTLLHNGITVRRLNHCLYFRVCHKSSMPPKHHSCGIGFKSN